MTVARLLLACGLGWLSGCNSTVEPALASLSVSPAIVQGGDPATGTVTLTAPAGEGGARVDLSSSQTSVVVPGSALVETGATTATFPVTTEPFAAGAAVTITASLSGVTRSAVLSLHPCSFLDPGAQWLAFSSDRSGRYQIWAMRDDATCLTQVTHADTPALFATWSPAGAIAYTTYRDGAMRIYVRDLTSATERLLDVGTLSATSPAFSPDGSLVAFEGYEAGVANVSDVYVVAATGGVPTKVTTGQRYSAGPAWSPDGSTIYFVSNRVSGYNVWGVPVGGGTETMLAGTSGILGRPTVSPGGTEIAYALAVSGASVSEVVVQTLSTGATRTLSTQADAEPSFDANGTGVVVTSQRGGNPELLLLDAATGSVLRHLTTDPAVDGLAAFGPFP